MTMGLSYLRSVESATACRETWLLSRQRRPHQGRHRGAPGFGHFQPLTLRLSKLIDHAPV
jgi:hypothetical protein